MAPPPAAKQTLQASASSPALNRQNSAPAGPSPQTPSPASLRGASSSGSVAVDEGTAQVKLIKYNSLGDGGLGVGQQQERPASGEPTDPNDENNNNNNRSVVSKSEDNFLVPNETKLSPSASTNKLWRIAQHRRDMANVGMANGNEHNEAFQIVWTQLAFEVETSAYDKIVNRTLSALRAVCSPASSGFLRSWTSNYAMQADGIETEKPPGSIAGDSRANLHSLESGTNLTNLTNSTATISTTTSDSNGGLVGGQRADKRVIFKNLNGYANSGELTAILGPSGAGKTSLMNAICGRTQGYRGRMRLIGANKQRRMRLSIIPQKDYLIENLTVRENLSYSSRILNPDCHFDHETNIERVVKMLNLTNCLHSKAASISGGEYKRVSIAQELLRQPDILVLDEPTSGLDSMNCKKLVSSLLQLIETSNREARPIAIVMTIHQPDVEVFHMFDHVYCMARGGRVIYDGAPGEVMATIGSDANIPGLRCDGEIASRVNPANLLIEIASEDLYGSEPVDRLARIQRKQFKQMHDNETGAVLTTARSHEELLGQAQQQQQHHQQVNLRQLHANLLAAAALAKAAERGSERELASSAASTVDCRAVGATAKTSISSLSDSKQTPLGSLWKSHRQQQQHNGRLVRDKRLTPKNNHSGLFWYFTRVLAERSFKSALRDPLMTIVVMLFHLSIPFVMLTVYSRRIGHENGCPMIQRELDIVSMASDKLAERVQFTHETVATTYECSTMFFLTTYSFSMCSLSVAALAFPLGMHILLKEVRNGWYNLSSFVLAKFIANLPFEVIFPVTSLVMIYLMLDMPGSAYEWRLGASALVMALVSMISHTQGLIFGALCMDSVQSAIFLASTFSLPQALLSGFTARIRFLPVILQRLSWLSQYRYSSDLINMIRFGFGVCPCANSTDEYLRTVKADFKDMPANLKPVFVYYLGNSNQEPENATTTTTGPPSLIVGQNATASLVQNATALISSSNASSALAPADQPQIPGLDFGVMLGPSERSAMLKRLESNEVDLFGKMANMVSRSFAFGRELDTCEAVRPQILYLNDTPKDSMLPTLFVAMFCLLVMYKILLFITVKHKIGRRL